MTPEQLADYNSASWFQLAIVPMAFYLAWVTFYYLLASPGRLGLELCKSPCAALRMAVTDELWQSSD